MPEAFQGLPPLHLAIKNPSRQDSGETPSELSPYTLTVRLQQIISTATADRFDMAIPKILFVLALVGATPTVYSKHASLWGNQVFPDDLSWLSPYKTHRSEDSTENEVDTKNYKVCETDECKKVAEEFLSSIDKSVDPCDDFYEFACGAWPATDPIPPSKASWSRFAIFQNTIQHRIKGVLETKPSPHDILPVRQAKKWYHSCMDTDTLKRRDMKPIESILMQAGGWPIIMDENEWDSELYSWQQVESYYARLTGAYTLYGVDVFAGVGDGDLGAIVIEAPEIPLSEQLPLKYRNYSGNDYDMYLTIVEGAADIFVERNRADVSKERMSKEAKEIVEFEKEIYELKQEREFTSMTFDEFVEWYDTNMTEVNSDPKAKIDWQSRIQKLFNMVNIKINGSTEIFTRDFGYIKGIGELLKKTPARAIVNYIHWNFISTMLAYTTESARDFLFTLVKEEYGVKERGPRWSECVDDMKMTHAAAYVFVDKYFTKSTETAALKMIKNIQIGMKDQIDKSNWLDEESKEWAKEKLDSMRMFIGFPEWYRNKTAVINHYKGLTIGAEYFDNSLSYMRYAALKKLKSLTTPDENIDIWDFIDPITVNAVYGSGVNMLSVPAADFQTPLFTPEFPNNVNYATVGVIAGHEMGHGFDDHSIHYGKSPNSSKLSGDLMKNYYQSAECFLDQFDGYFEGYYGTEAPESDEATNSSRMSMGLLTRAENIADSTGIQSVYEAYEKVKKNLPSGDTRLPGLEGYTDDQLFFLSFAAMWCEVNTPEYEKKTKEEMDVHSPPKFRVLGAVSNAKDFAKAFNCPKGSPMNPTDKCSIWQKPGATVKSEPGSGPKKRKNHHRWGGQWRS